MSIRGRAELSYKSFQNKKTPLLFFKANLVGVLKKV